MYFFMRLFHSSRGNFDCLLAVYPNQLYRTPTTMDFPQPSGEAKRRRVRLRAGKSPLSIPSDQSDLSSRRSIVSSKATTPVDIDSSRGSHGSEDRIKKSSLSFKPKMSIPSCFSGAEYASECIFAADWSMLNAYFLHPEEYQLLRNHISHAQVTTYLNVRNGIIRLWVNNPQVAVTREEAIGCAKDPRWFDVANLCFDWLIRRGHINFGCVKHGKSQPMSSNLTSRKQKTIVIIGAGLAGLGCARQLEGLLAEYSEKFFEVGEMLPRIIILEGRKRIGGRVYSRPITSDQTPLPGYDGNRFTVEIGGMIITGFERGNPLNMIVRGQLKLPYHELRPDTTLYDVSGKAVDTTKDALAERLYNDCLDRVSLFKYKLTPPKLVGGNREMMDEGRDSMAEGQKSISQYEEATAALPHALPVSEQSRAPHVDLIPTSTDRVTGKPNLEPGQPAALKSAEKAIKMGWQLKQGVSQDCDLDLDTPSRTEGATLGSVMDDCISQYKQIVDLTPLDLRLINWHIANLEYSNASNYRNLSLQGWDIDTGNEWEGKHTMIIGGYQKVPRGLMLSPTPLSVSTGKPVTRITYSTENPEGLAEVECEDGEVIAADYVVNTIPLGVLKQGTVRFEPELPLWKQNAIERLGFGVLNKVILVFDHMFWDHDKDFFGILRSPNNSKSLNQQDYTTQRGRFFQWLNVSNTSGIPVLLALMAGDAAFDVEHTNNDDLIKEAMEVLRTRFGHRIPHPRQALVSRWASDRFARGSYSSAGPNMKVDDYDTMAKPVGNLFFAGEHTTGTHPATVHGAYLSGLRAAGEIIDTLLGPLTPKAPLVKPKENPHYLKRKAEQTLKDPKRVRQEAWEMECWDFVKNKIGECPIPPPKVAGKNAYMLFSRANFEEARRRCAEGRRAGKGKPAPNEVRIMTSKMWKEATAEDKKPFEEEYRRVKEEYMIQFKEWEQQAQEWNRQADEYRIEFKKKNPFGEKGEANSCPGVVPSGEDMLPVSRRRRGKTIKSYAEKSDDDDMD